MGRHKIYLIYGNQEDKVSERRFTLIQELIAGEEDVEVVDLRAPGNQSYTLDRAYEEILQEMGTVSLIPGTRRIVVVHELADFRTKPKGSAREAKKAAAGKKDYVAALEEYLTSVMPESDNALIFVHNDDDEKYKKVEPTSPLFQLVAKLGEVYKFVETRLDYQLEDALLASNVNRAIALTRELLDRGGSSYRLMLVLNNFLQLLLQARLEGEARHAGLRTDGLFPEDMKPSIAKTFKAAKFRQLAPRFPTSKLRAALNRLNDIQKSFFPTGEELVVHDAAEQIEVMYLELFARD